MAEQQHIPLDVDNLLCMVRRFASIESWHYYKQFYSIPELYDMFQQLVGLGFMVRRDGLMVLTSLGEKISDRRYLLFRHRYSSLLKEIGSEFSSKELSDAN